MLEKLERQGIRWVNGGEKPTEFTPKPIQFPYGLFTDDEGHLQWGNMRSLEDEEIVYDGRKEEKMSEKYVVSQEFMSNLKNWKKDLMTYGKHGYFVGYMDIGGLPAHVYDWLGENISNEENNNRLIAILRWVNGEDVFEVEKPKKWVVRSKNTYPDGTRRYVQVIDGFSDWQFSIVKATYFNTKEEAESWANSHQEVVEVKE